MARLLVQLKLRLLANALRSSNRARASFMVSTAFAAATALGMFALLASLHGQSTRGGSDLGPVHPLRLRLADPAAAGLRPGQHPGSGHDGPVPAADPPAGHRAAGRLGHRRVAGRQRDRPARGADRAGPRRARRAGRPGRGAAAGAVLHHPGPLRDHQHGRAAALPPRQGPGRLPVHPDHRRLRVLHPGRAEAGRHREADHRELHRLRRVDALAAAGPGRARDPGRLGRASRHRPDAPGAAGRHHRRARLAVDPVAGPCPGLPGLLHPVIAGAGHGAAAGPVRPARRGGRPILDLPAP